MLGFLRFGFVFELVVVLLLLGFGLFEFRLLIGVLVGVVMGVLVRFELRMFVRLCWRLFVDLRVEVRMFEFKVVVFMLLVV